MHSASPPLALLAQVAAAVPNGSVNIFDADLRYLFASGPGLAAVGLDPQHLVGRTVRDAFGPEAALVEEQFGRALRGEQVTFDLPVFDRTYSASAAPLDVADGVVRSIVVLAQDVTGVREDARRREAQQVAWAATARDRDAFIATVAHELRQPLAPLKMALNFLRHAPDGAQREQLWGVIDRQVLQLERLIADLSTASDQQTLQTSAIDLSQVVDEAVQQIAPMAEAQQREVIWQRSAPLLVEGDPVRLRQVLSNLLHNAVKFTDPGGRIAVAATAMTDIAQVIVADNGNGIAADLLPRVFDLFVRQPTERGGTGIGLNVVRRLVELHGGTVEARSAGIGRGSEFVVRLPLTSSARERRHDQ